MSQNDQYIERYWWKNPQLPIILVRYTDDANTENYVLQLTLVMCPKEQKHLPIL